jgi:autotransporter-associated beta strand protein
LPGAAGSGVTSSQHDTVILERPNANITVTLASGTHNIRKLYMRETLNLTGGSLTVNYVPSPDSTPVSAQFSGSVTLSGSGSLSVHTLQVDATQTFTLGGGTLTFNTIHLQPNTPTPAEIAVTGNVTVNPLTYGTAVIQNGVGVGSSGLVDFDGGTPTLTIGNGTAEVDLSVATPMQNGGWAKGGLGTMRITAANTYNGGTTVSAGLLLVNNTSGSGTGGGAVTVNGGILGGTGSIAGIVTANAGGTLAPGTASALGTLTLNSAPVLAGTSLFRIDRNSGSPLTDKIVLTSGTLNYGGTLVVSNVGATLVGGEAYELFNAPSYSGAFLISNLPALSPGLNWSTSGLTVNGSIKVNRSPIAGVVSFTNDAPNVLQIPIATLINLASDADGDTLALAGINLTSTNGVALFTNDTVITYSNYVSVADQLTYTLSDGQGGSATGTVQIVASPMGRFTVAAGNNGTAMSFDFVGSPGWTYFLERSTNLPAWVTIWTNVAPASGLFDYTDNFQDLPAPPARAFYRLRWSP